MSDNGSNPESFGHASWVKKFSTSFRGLMLGIKGGQTGSNKNSFIVHIPIAVGVLIAAVVMKFSLLAIVMLMFCIGLVFVAELFNSSIESLSRAITREYNPDIGMALDVASGAVLAASLTAVTVGVILFGYRLTEMLAG